VENAVPGARSRQYRKSTLRQWLLALFAMAVWFHADRPARELGLGLDLTPRFWLALALATALGLAWRQLFRQAMNDDEGRERLITQLRVVQPLLPSTLGELRLFTGLSITAGICEELLFRGYLIWYLTAFVGFPAACVLSGVLFGLGHLYQGLRQAVKIIFLGLVFVAFYVGSGSLWIPMALHALLDAAQGRIAHKLLSSENTSTENTP
jgi:membrane protease YdiL (CAAX protease family)